MAQIPIHRDSTGMTTRRVFLSRLVLLAISSLLLPKRKLSQPILVRRRKLYLPGDDDLRLTLGLRDEATPVLDKLGQRLAYYAESTEWARVIPYYMPKTSAEFAAEVFPLIDSELPGNAAVYSASDWYKKEATP